jgi:hypothetical protein
VLAELTDLGRSVVEAATAALVEIEFGLAGIAEPDRAELFGGLRRLRAAAGDFRLAHSGEVTDPAG